MRIFRRMLAQFQTTTLGSKGREMLDCIKVMHCDAPMPRRSAKKNPKSPRITISLSPEDHEQVTRMAKSKKVSASWIVRDAVEKYLTADIPLLANVNGRHA